MEEQIQRENTHKENEKVGENMLERIWGVCGCATEKRKVAEIECCDYLNLELGNTFNHAFKMDSP